MDGQALTTATSQRSTTSPGEREIGAHIAKLLAHYFVPDMEPAAQRSLAADWLTDLREFDPATVSAACDDWRQRPGGKRPTSGDIRAFCVTARQSQRYYSKALADHSEPWPRELLEIWGPPPKGPQDRAQALRRQERDRRRRDAGFEDGAVIADKWAQERGWADRNEFYDAGGSPFEIMGSIIKQMPGPARGRWDPTREELEKLGVTAKPAFEPTLDQMQTARAELGLPHPEMPIPPAVEEPAAE